jgi:hypothetical protein
MISEKVLLEFFEHREKPVTLRDLQSHFDESRMAEILVYIEFFKKKALIAPEPHKENTWYLTPFGSKIIRGTRELEKESAELTKLPVSHYSPIERVASSHHQFSKKWKLEDFLFKNIHWKKLWPGI